MMDAWWLDYSRHNSLYHGRRLDGGQLGSIYVTVPPVMEGAPHWAATLDLGGRAHT